MLSPLTLNVLVAVFILLADNSTFWRGAGQIFEHGLVT